MPVFPSFTGTAGTSLKYVIRFYAPKLNFAKALYGYRYVLILSTRRSLNTPDNPQIKAQRTRALGTTSSFPPALVNKDLLEHSQTHSFAYCLWLLSHCNCREEMTQLRIQDLQTLTCFFPVSSKEVCQFLISNYAQKINSLILVVYFPLRALVFPEEQQQNNSVCRVLILEWHAQYSVSIS